MIIIAGTYLPECAVWTNEIQHATPKTAVTECSDGCSLVHTGGLRQEIDIYIPKIAGQLTRQTVTELKTLAQTEERNKHKY